MKIAYEESHYKIVIHGRGTLVMDYSSGEPKSLGEYYHYDFEPSEALDLAKKEIKSLIKSMR